MFVYCNAACCKNVPRKREIPINDKYLTNKFFFDVIYNPKETFFLKKARENGNKTQNGKMMFIYQAHQAFTIWHKLMPEINEKTISLLDE